MNERKPLVVGLTLALRAAKADADTGASFQDEVTQLHAALADETGRAEAVAAKCTDAERRQGLTLVHFSAQRKRFLWDRGCIEGLFRGCCVGVYEVLGDVGGLKGVLRVRNGSG